jgi:hypothetical protein
MHYIYQLKNLSKYSGTCAIRILSFPKSNKMYGPKVFLLTKVKSEYSDILCNPTQLLGQLAELTVYSTVSVDLITKIDKKLFDCLIVVKVFVWRTHICVVEHLFETDIKSNLSGCLCQSILLSTR